MNTRASFVARIEGYCSRTGLNERQFGLAAMDDHGFMRRIRKGRGVTLTLIERAEAYMRANPAPGAPSGVVSHHG